MDATEYELIMQDASRGVGGLNVNAFEIDDSIFTYLF